MSFKEGSEKCVGLHSSSTSSVHTEIKNKNSTATNRVSPPTPHLTINQFQPVFKETRKKKQDLNTKTNDNRNSLDQTSFKTLPDRNSSNYSISSEPNEKSKSNEGNHFLFSNNNLFSDGSITHTNLDPHQHNQSSISLENKYTGSPLLCNKTKASACSDKSNDIGNENHELKSIKTVPKLNLVSAQSSNDSSKVQCFVMSPSPSSNINDVEDVFNLDQSQDDNFLSAVLTEPKETIVSCSGINENTTRNGSKITTEILNEDFLEDISDELFSGASPSKIPLLGGSEMGNSDDENSDSKKNLSIMGSNSRPSSWASNKTRKLSLLGTNLLSLNSSKLKAKKQTIFVPPPLEQETSSCNQEKIPTTRLSRFRRVKFNKNEDDTSSNSSNDVKDPER